MTKKNKVTDKYYLNGLKVLSGDPNYSLVNHHKPKPKKAKKPKKLKLDYAIEVSFTCSITVKAENDKDAIMLAEKKFNEKYEHGVPVSDFDFAIEDDSPDW